MSISPNTTNQLVLHLYREIPGWTDPNVRFSYIGPVYQIEDGSQIVVEQANRFDQHTINVKDVDLMAIHALEGRIYVEMEQVGQGRIALGRVVSPTQEMNQDGTGRIGLTLENVTEELTLVRTGMGYRDSQEVRTIVENLGAVTHLGESVFNYSQINKFGVPGYDDFGRAVTIFTPGKVTGWSAEYIPSNTYVPTSAPVDWSGGRGGVYRYATFNGNTLKADPAHTQVGDGGGVGWPTTFDLYHDAAYTFEIVDTTQNTVTGIGPNPNIGLGYTMFSFQIFNQSWRILEFGGVVGPSGPAVGTTTFSIVYRASTGQIEYYVNNAIVYISGLMPVAPLTPQATFFTQNGEVTNPTFSKIALDSELWWKVAYDDPTLLSAFISLSKDVDIYVRQARETDGTPLRKLEMGTFGNLTKMRLIDGTGADPDALMTNLNVRVIKTINQQGPDFQGLVNLITPLGGGAGDSQVTVEHLWRILYDHGYANYGRYAGGPYESLGNLFPERQPQYTIHRTPTDAGGYQYYMKSQPSIAQWGEIVGGAPDSTYTYQQDSNNNRAFTELTERGLYSATVGRFIKGDQPHYILDVTTTWNRYTPRAAEKLTVDYTGYGFQNGVFLPKMRVNDEFFIMKVTRTFGAEITDTFLLSNLGKYTPTDGSVQADVQRQQRAMQVVQNTAASVSILGVTYRELDAGNDPLFPGDHSIVYPIKILPTATRVQAAYFRVDFLNFRQTVTDAKGGGHHHTVSFTIPGHTHGPVSGLITEDAPISGSIPHQHYFNVLVSTSGGTAPVDGDLWISGLLGTGADADKLILTGRGQAGGARKVMTSAAVDIVALDLSKTKGTHAIKGVHQPSGVFHLTDTVADAPVSFSTFTSTDGEHTHDLLPKINDTFRPAQILVEIDSGDGVFVNRTAELINLVTNTSAAGFKDSFEFECARFIDSPGRTVRIKFVSIGDDGNPYGLGCLGISGTISAEYNGLGTIIRQQE